MNERAYREAEMKMAAEMAQKNQMADTCGMAEGPSRRSFVGTPWRQAEVVRQFESHIPTEDQAARMNLIREAGKAFALTLQAHVPPGNELESAIMGARVSVMIANAAIVAG